MGGMLQVTDLAKSFGDRLAVDRVTFEIAAGEVYGLLGPNGAGKTTSISMISGILPRDSGSVVIDGINLDEGPAARARLGLVTQSVTLYQDLTGRENLRFWGQLYDLSGRELNAAVDDGLKAVGLTDRAGDAVSTYSGGMQRRLNLAAGLLHRPAVLILDEPTVGVDPQSRSAIFELIERLRDDGMAVLYTTHYMEEAERLCARIGVIDSGKIVAEGTKGDLIARLGREVRVELTFEKPELALRAAGLLERVEGVARTLQSNSHLVAFVDDGRRRLPSLLSKLIESNLEPTTLELRSPDLEDVFLELTGKALRD
jgi:ABC-2 type transport system ATP-binding protein